MEKFESGQLSFKDNDFVFCQLSVSPYIVDAITEGIKAGCVLPHITVEKISNSKYGIFDGNHRFMAYKLLGIDPLVMNLGFSGLKDYRLGIDDVVFEKELFVDKEFRLRRALNLIPRDIAVDFCKRRSLDSKEFLPQ